MTDVLHMLFGAALVAIGVLAAALADRIRGIRISRDAREPRPSRAQSAPAARSVIPVKDLRQLGAEAKIYDPRDASDDRVFVYLSGCSFQKGDLVI